MVLQIPRMAIRLFSTTPEKVVEISRAAQLMVRLFLTTSPDLGKGGRNSSAFFRPPRRGSNITVQFIFDPFQEIVTNSYDHRLHFPLSYLFIFSENIRAI